MKLNTRANEKTEVECRVCRRSTNHRILASADENGSEWQAPDYEISWSSSHQIVQCLGCETISFRVCSESSEDNPIQIGPDEWVENIQVDVYPNPNEGRKSLADSHLFPSQVERIYNETVAALNNQQPVLCGIGIRALIETVTKEKNATSRDLFGKINDLVSMGVLTREGADILHKVRTLGNSAAHDVKPHTPQQLGLAMDVVEHLLQGVYILPHHATRTFT